MKTSRYLTISSALVLLVASLSMNTWATEAGYGAQNNVSTHNHFALAEQYENLAKEMQAKATEQMEILEHKPRSSFFGKNGQHIKFLHSSKQHKIIWKRLRTIRLLLLPKHLQN